MGPIYEFLGLSVGVIQHEMSDEERKANSAERSRGQLRRWANTSEVEREEISTKRAEVIKKTCADRTDEERATLSATMSEARKRMWAKMSEEEGNERIKNQPSSWGQKDPTDDESFADCYQREKFPGEWRYNGCVPPEERVVIGKKIPDFININGKKAVVEVLGWRHLMRGEENLPEHYKKYGFECRIIWWYDCYNSKELDKVFGNASTS